MIKQVYLAGCRIALVGVALSGCGADTSESEITGEVQQAESHYQRADRITKKGEANANLIGSPQLAIEQIDSPSSRKGARGIYPNGDILYGDAVNAAYMVYGYILGKYRDMDLQMGALRYPTTDETETVYGDGRYNWFERGRIYWKKGAASAYETHGKIDDVWWALGSEIGNLGFPISDQHNYKQGDYVQRRSDFEYGSVFSLTDADATWPVLVRQNVNNWKLSAYGNPYLSVTNYSCCIRASGSNFTPGDYVTVYHSTPGGPEALDGVGSAVVVRADGSFSWTESAGCASETPKYKVPAVPDGYLVTVFARDQHGATAVAAHDAGQCDLINRVYPGM